MKINFSFSGLAGNLVDTVINCIYGFRLQHLVYAGGAVFIFMLAYAVYPELSITQPPGILVPSPPQQTLLPLNAVVINYKDYTLAAMASYDITARVIARKAYSFGRDAEIAPIDLLLGWQEMSDTRILKNISFHLSQRFYSSSWQTSLLPEETANKEVANNHLIPANKQIERFLRRTRIGQVIHLKGYLVSISHSDGYHWESSLSREDSGAGACELMYVESAN